jgi:hypothetical protein
MFDGPQKSLTTFAQLAACKESLKRIAGNDGVGCPF